jgi:hypothetical protein
VAQALPAQVECPKCRTRFLINGPARPDKAALIKKDHDAVRGMKNGVRAPGSAPVRTFGQGPTPAIVPSAVVSSAYQSRRSGGGWGILIACLLGLALLVAIVVIAVLNMGKKNETQPLVEQLPEIPFAPAAPVISERQRKIEDAIRKGVAYLRREILTPTEKNFYFNDPGAGSNVGVLALAGLTLLECGVASTDPAVEKVLKTVREETPRLRFTYSIALCILFLDRLVQAPERASDPSHKSLIQRLTVQLMAAQNTKGGWDYYCAILSPEQQNKLLDDIKADRFRPGSFEGERDDNSINQFATLALWQARKHGVKTGPALAKVETRYLQNQNDDGSWGYHARDDGPLKDSTTCAGLIGLAVGQGIRHEAAGNMAPKPQDPTKIPAIAHGLDYIAKTIGKDPRRMNPVTRDRHQKHTAEMMGLNRSWQEAPDNERSALQKKIDAIDDAKLFRGTYFNSDSWGDLYFLWSVERVAVIFDLKKIGNKDWYDWGVDVILPNQKEDGSWRDRFPGMPDTCFALLFLKRANIVKDLTDKFRVLAAAPVVRSAPERGDQAPPPPAQRKE